MPHTHKTSVAAMARLRRMLTVLIPLLSLLHAYIGWRLLPALVTSGPGWVVGSLLLLLSVLAIPLSLVIHFMDGEPALLDRLSAIGSTALGLFSSLLVLTVLRDVLLLLWHPDWLYRGSAMAVPILALLMTLIGWSNARQLARVVKLDIPLRGLPESLSGFTIAQISDIHVGPTIKRDYVDAIVKQVNALQADLVAITGDLVDGQVDHLAAHVAPLAGLQSRHGSFVVLGNHDYYSGADEWAREYQRLGLRVLMNEHVVIEQQGAELMIAGVTDYNAHQFNEAQRSDPFAAQKGSPQGVNKILLAHQPRSAIAAEAAGFELVLAGHTHGGQFWPWNHFVRLQQPFTAGLHRLGRLWVYTSRGTGYWGPPKRFWAPSEITLLRLLPAKE